VGVEENQKSLISAGSFSVFGLKLPVFARVWCLGNFY
jgi:hypothetical protein